MDNNSSKTATNPISASPQEQMSQQTPPVNAVPQPSSENASSTGKLAWIIIGVVVLILLLGGLYFWFVNNKQSTISTLQATPTPIQNVDSLKSELDSSPLDDLDKEFSSVDKDLQEL